MMILMIAYVVLHMEDDDDDDDDDTHTFFFFFFFCDPPHLFLLDLPTYIPISLSRNYIFLSDTIPIVPLP